MDGVLTGAGHFGFGFLCGSIVMAALQRLYSKKLFVQLYAPFIPFVLGLIAAAPYALLGDPAICNLPIWSNIFLLYNSIHCHPFVVSVLGGLNKVAIICGSVYVYIVLRYISLVRHCRSHGWGSR